MLAKVQPAHQLQQPLQGWDALSCLCGLSGAGEDLRTHRQGLKCPLFIVAIVRIMRQKTMKMAPGSHVLTP